jgi:hypothetical protein
MGNVDISPCLEYEVFENLQDHNEFMKVSNGGYFVEWDCCAALSVDAIEAWRPVTGKATPSDNCLTDHSVCHIQHSTRHPKGAWIYCLPH